MHKYFFFCIIFLLCNLSLFSNETTNEPTSNLINETSQAQIDPLANESVLETQPLTEESKLPTQKLESDIQDSDPTIEITDSTTDNDLSFAEDRFVRGAFMLMFEPIATRFAYQATQLDPGTVVADPLYFPETNESTGITTNPNMNFNFDPEYSFTVGGHFKVEKWLTVGINFGASYEQTSFIAQVVPDGSPDGAPALPTYYAFDLNSNGVKQLSIMGKDYTGSDGTEYSSASLNYGVVRLEVSPSLQFFPLQNAMEDLNGLFIGVEPMFGFDMNTAFKTHLDILYQNNIRGVEYVQGENLYTALQKLIHEDSNWNLIQTTLEDSGGDLTPYLRFYGGVKMDIGWQGVIENGIAIKTSAAVGWDSSRGLYTQIKAGIGYLFR